MRDTVESLYELATDGEDGDCARVDACAELVKLNGYPATAPMVQPLMQNLMGVLRSVMKAGEGIAKVRAGRLILRIALLSQVPSKPRRVTLKPITEVKAESA